MSWLVAIGGVVIFVELFIRLPLLAVCTVLLRIASKAVAVLRAEKISDHWKEKVLLKYALLIARHSLVLFLLILLCVAPLLCLATVFGAFGVPVYGYLYSLPGLLVCTVAGVGYAACRSRVVNRAAAK